ncbi:MAG TPA: lysylphosphatidylglycerol synthase transmembrane domain-containing protein [Blastocatellia bacterium]|nr:lysylphosphatidylglycerol synthase transmembrane domain-containing protein [Blastocatellia bacterium]
MSRQAVSLRDIEQLMQRRQPKAPSPTNAAPRGISLRGLAQVIIGVGALALVIARSDLHSLLEAIRSTRVAYLPLAVLASFAVTWLMASRWRAILAVRGQRFKTYRLFAVYLIGIFFMNFIPGGGVSGDVARLIYVDREVRDKAFVLSTLVYERMVGGFIILLLGLVASVASHSYAQTNRVVLSEIVLAVAFAAAAMLMSERVSSRLARVCRALGGRFKLERFGQAAARTLEAISELRHHRRMVISTLALSVLVRAVWSLGCYIVALALGLPLSFATVFAFMSLVDLVRMLPVSIGGIGVREWLLVALFAGVGLSREQALAFALLAFAPIYCNAIAGGIIYISMARLKQPERPIAELDLKGSEAG